MFRPMAITVCSALIGALVLALTVVPAAASVFLKNRVHPHRDGWFERVRTRYIGWLLASMRIRGSLSGSAVVLVGVSLGSLVWIGTEFMPRLDEGSILVETRKLPGISLTESVAISHRIEQVMHVSGSVGRGDEDRAARSGHGSDGRVPGRCLRAVEATDAMADRLVERTIDRPMSEELEKIPGVAYNFTQPMAMRLDEVVSGIKADVAVKIFGEDPTVLEQEAERVLRVLSGAGSGGRADGDRFGRCGVARGCQAPGTCALRAERDSRARDCGDRGGRAARLRI
jgi:heavy metal efflux system protein